MEHWSSSPRIIQDHGDEISKQRLIKSQQKSNPLSKEKKVSLMNQNKVESHENLRRRIHVAQSLDKTISSLFTRDRRSACCVEIERKYYKDCFSISQPDSIHVGISHTKSRQRMWSNQGDQFNYLTRLYTFSSTKPYGLIAIILGLFCFSYPEDDDATGVNDDAKAYLFWQEKPNHLELNRESYEFPHIHIQFVSGITNKVNDDSRLIVAYGVNDCVPRFVEISNKILSFIYFWEMEGQDEFNL